ncbi:MAG TPA: NADPH-dependent assimilatory sulfite reductase hemoprotein subunit [Candidatus Acidoferrales bacterium]|nr:NADPH-dependent assimilatory sulfite reductase hemoprotein subunit [Candidatus Acidoferrales bacterium]
MDKDLITLGPGKGSKVEAIKLASHYLRGDLAEVFAADTTHIDEDAANLLKFHGSYQQEDRDQRAARKAAGEEKAYQFMIRSRIPGGVLTAEQYLAHDDLAGKYGNGTVRLTTRQSIQLHGVLKHNLRSTIREINDALLSTLAACGDVNRNVMGCPAPLADRAQAHILETVNAIMHHLAPHTHAYHELWLNGERVDPHAAANDDEPIYGPTYLPRKFKIGVAHGGDNCVDVFTQDIGLISMLEGDRLAGFTLVIGGGMGMTHNKPNTYPHAALPLCFVTPEEVIPVVEAIVTVQRDYGDRTDRKHARMKYVVAERGIPWYRQRVEERLGRKLADPRAIAFDNVDDHLGWHRQADGAYYLGVFVQSGRIKDDGTFRLRSGLRQLVETLKPGIRITGQQNLLITDIAADQRTQVEDILRTHGVEVDPERLGVSRFSMACPASPTCGLAVAESERALPKLLEELEAELASLGLSGERLSVRITGCPNGCARPYMGDIGFVGRSAGLYDVFLGGDWQNTRLNAHYAAGVRYEQLIPSLRPLLLDWRERRMGDETFGAFVHRVGFDALRATQVKTPAVTAS